MSRSLLKLLPCISSRKTDFPVFLGKDQISALDLFNCEIMNFKIQLFATLKTSLGRSGIEIKIAASSTVADLVDQLVDQYPLIGPLIRTSLVAVNHEFAAADQILLPGDEIALFPAVSGG